MRRRADWDDDYWYGSIDQGSVHDLSADKPETETAAIIWVPDPEQRHGWREYYVTNEKPNTKPDPMGFKPKAKP